MSKPGDGTPLRGRTAIVTGAALGIGRSFARALGRAGAAVTICDVRPEVHETAAILAAEGLAVEAHLADVAEPADVLRVVRAASSRTGTIDVLVNNAAIVRLTPHTAPFDSALADFDDVMGTNLRGVFMFGRAVIPLMVASGGGNIVNVATDHIHTCGWPEPVGHDEAAACAWAGERRRPGWVGLDVYDASKWGLNGLTQEWAKSLRREGVRVNSLCMGATDSHMQRSFYGFDEASPPPPELLATWMDPDELGRILVELLLEGPTGRSGDNIGLWRGHPTVLPPPSPTLAVPADFDPATDMVGAGVEPLEAR